MSRTLLISSIAALLLSCDREGGQADSTVPDVTGAVEKATAGTDDAVGDVKPDLKDSTPQTQYTEATAKDAVADVEKTSASLSDEASKVTDALPDVEGALDSSFSISKLKEAVGSLSSDKLTGFADHLMTAVKHEDGIVKGLQEQIGKLGVTDLGKAGDLKKQVESALGGLGGLKEKLNLVVAKLKESGIDVSKYTAFLGGN